MNQKTTTVAFLLLAALSVSAIVAVAQHSQHHPAQATPNEEPKTGSMMSRKMMSEGMIAHHQKMETLVDQLLESFAALQNETNPAAAKDKLAEHGALLEQLQNKFKERSKMMQKMTEHMKNCPMMGGEQKRE